MEKLGTALVENTVLEELDLSHNSLGGLAVKALSKGLMQNQVLVRLDLSYTRCGEAGAKALYKLLVKEQVEADERRKRMAARAARAEAESAADARDTHGHETSDEESESETEEEAALRELEEKQPSQIIRLCCRFEPEEKPASAANDSAESSTALAIGSGSGSGSSGALVARNNNNNGNGDGNSSDDGSEDDEDVRVYVLTKKDTYLSLKDMLVEEYGVNLQLTWERTEGRGDMSPLKSQHDLNDVFEAYAGKGKRKGLGRVECVAREIGVPLGLKTLNLANAMGDTHAAIVVEALRLNHTVEEIDLSGCQMGDETVKALTVALQEGKNDTLCRLLLSFNRIGLEGAKSLAEMLRSNNTLLLLDVGGNSFGRPATRALRMALEENQRLCTLSQALMKHQGDGMPVVSRIPKNMF